ncbi:MAG: hypothetical protein HON47_04820 [Candidatus Diapherotrites archaeon]|jgi:hypothetical protein|uniref:Uncharacterized protein n=1 Tax=Candidatus Iainarchaeum sp. TaxID=3101447 RepID=A0A8T5GG57_9ARCH|nr:hypothetical protein [Candidatus Diapherotrites archaeon]MBT7241280.1 hypothetical protein [Candidatus Diapherotrites archaeon]
MASQKVGSYAFLLGVIIALIAGIIQVAVGLDAVVASWLALILVILGLIVGFLNIKDKHVTDFLIATIAVAMIGLIALNPAVQAAPVDMIAAPIVALINAIVGNIVTLVAPAALIVGVKQIIALTKEQVV